MDQRDYEALHNAAGTIELQRGKIALTGEDRVRWLHGMVTNDVKGLTPGTGCYCFVLDVLGHVQADCNVYMEQDRLIVDCEAFLTAKLMTWFDRYIVMDDVQMTDISAEMQTVAVEGPSATAAAIDTDGWIAFPVPRGVWLWGRDIHVPSEKAVPVSAEAYEVVRIESGIPRYGTDIDDTVIANETGQLRALHFNKGCYLGQEIVERVRSRGHVNRIFTGFRSNTEIAPGTFEGGRITSAAFSPALNRWIALGYIRRDQADQPAPGMEVTQLPFVPAAPAAVFQPPAQD